MFRTPIKFIKLAPQQSARILIGSAIAGLMQSLTAFSLLPLSDILGIPGVEQSKFIAVFKSILDSIGMNYSLVNVLIFMILFISIFALINFITKSYSAKVSAKLVRRLRVSTIDSVLSAEWSYFTGKKSGEFVHSILTEAGKTSAGYIDSINFFSAVVQGCVILISTLFIDIRVALYSIVVGILILYIFKSWIGKARKASTKTGQLLQSVTEIITDGMGGMKPLKTMNRDHLMTPLLNAETKGLEKQQYRLFIVSAIPQIMRQPIVTLFMAIGLSIIITQSLIPVATIIPMALLFQRTAEQFGITQGTFQSIKKMEPFLESLEANISKAKSYREDWPGENDPVFNKEIKFDNVKFAYGDKIIFNGISLSIRKNTIVAIVGPSGTGKTTFVDILCGLYKPGSGEVMIDDINFIKIDIKKWRSNIGYVPQDLFLFHDTVANNISLGDTKISISEIEKALKSAGAWEFVSELNEGINTNIGERGFKLSGGQRQRLAIARAIVSNPQLLILDEATTALDPKTEKRILKTIQELTKKGITVVAVSHQKALIDISDEVFGLENGVLNNLSNSKLY